LCWTRGKGIGHIDLERCFAREVLFGKQTSSSKIGTDSRHWCCGVWSIFNGQCQWKGFLTGAERYVVWECLPALCIGRLMELGLSDFNFFLFLLFCVSCGGGGFAVCACLGIFCVLTTGFDVAFIDCRFGIAGFCWTGCRGSCLCRCRRPGCRLGC